MDSPANSVSFAWAAVRTQRLDEVSQAKYIRVKKILKMKNTKFFKK